MTQGIKDIEQDARTIYADIIDLPHHQSPTRKHMSLQDRAAQFSPFAALTGYDDMIAEEARQTNAQLEQDADLLDQKLSLISAALSAGTHPALTFIVFVPDERKTGGRYEEVSGTVRKIDRTREVIVLYAANGISDGRVIEIRNIQDIRSELLDPLDDRAL